MKTADMPSTSATSPDLIGRALRFRDACACCEPLKLCLGGDRIAKASPLPAGTTAADSRIIMPAFANGHDHVRGVPPTALAAYDMPLELWLAQMSGLPACDPYLIAVAALGRQALSGCASIMIHYTRPQDPGRLVDELEVVASAARAVGVRVAIAPALRDINALSYGIDDHVLQNLPPQARLAIEQRLLSHPPAPIADQLEWVNNAAARLAGNPLVDIQYGPYGVEWCSDAMLAAVAEASADSGRRVHMHLLEARVQREYLDARYPRGVLRFLDDIGLLSERLSVGHAVWLRPDEMDLLAERGVSVSINSSSNLGLRNGTAPVPEMHRRGVRLAQGLDGFSVDDDDDAFRELRLNYLLHRGTGYDDGVPLAALFEAACHGGRRIVTGDPGHEMLRTGGPADFMVLDRTALADDLLLEVEDAFLVAQRATRASLRHLFVAGREIVRDGRLLGLDLPAAQEELMAQVQHGLPAYRDWRQVTSAWAKVLREAYMSGLHRR